MGSKKAIKENDLLNVYLDDPEYRTILIKNIVKEDKDMENIANELAKLFTEEEAGEE